VALNRQFQIFDPKAKYRDDLTGLVFDMQRFAIHDGPGIRTLIFLKGCPLHCHWCQNPESIGRQPEIMLVHGNCINCGKCLDVCPEGAIAKVNEGETIIDRELCTLCGECAKFCYANSINISGRYLTVAEVLAEVERDRKFYERTGGGMTLSGGEPCVQSAFVAELARQAQARKLHTAIETCGHTRWEVLAGILQFMDLVLYDIKHMNSEAHRRLTGVSNELILENAQRVASLAIPMRVRMPLMPGMNDSIENVQATAAFTASLPNIEAFDILPYHRMGEPKWGQLGQPYKLHGVAPHSRERVYELFDIACQYGVEVTVGG
jgi:pyruvate formate lyase activating enzyme